MCAMRFRAGVLPILLCCFPASVFAGGGADKATEPKTPPAASPSGDKTGTRSAPGAAAKSAAPQIPDEFKLNMLIRSMIIAVNQANKTGNYTVLRDLGSPKFKAANSADRLSSIFASLRKTRFDLSPILFFTPKLIRLPAIQEDGMLRVTGFFDTRPQLVTFDFLFESVDGEWMLYGIDIGTQPAPANSGQNTPAPKSDRTGTP